MAELGSFKVTMKTACADLLKFLRSVGEIACEGHQDFHVGSDGGFMFTAHRKVGQEMRIHFERVVSWYQGTQLMPLYSAGNLFNFFLSTEVKSTDTNIVNNSQQRGNEYGRVVRS